MTNNVFYDDKQLASMGAMYDSMLGRLERFMSYPVNAQTKTALAVYILELVEARGNAPRAVILQGSPVPCTAPMELLT